VCAELSVNVAINVSRPVCFPLSHLSKYPAFAEVVVKSLTLVLRFIKICVNCASNRSGFLYADCHYIASLCECRHCCVTSVIHKVLYLFLLKEHWRIIRALTN
jgi:hypothetical protein